MTQFTPLAMTKKLVSYDTTSRDSNLDLIMFAVDYLKGLGVDATLIHNADKNKANLYATIGPPDVPGVVLSGHSDVVPVDGQDWSTAPFDPVESNGRLFGRGTSDMKSFIATALALAPDMLAADLKMPIHFAFSYDEEVGCLGVHGIVSHLAGISPLPRAVIVGEPTDMKVVNAHKGVFAFRTSVHGLEAHSSATNIGVNAVMYAAQLVSYLSELADDQREITATITNLNRPIRPSMSGPSAAVRRSTSFQKNVRSFGSTALFPVKAKMQSSRSSTSTPTKSFCRG